jgi:CheY-like chemotaxis protein
MSICILIVDDCDISRFVAKSLIQNVQSDAIILEAYDGQEAIDLLKSLDTLPHITLLDLNMPGMDGFTFLEENKQESILDKNIVILSSSSRNDDIAKCKEFNSVADYMTKPLSENDIAGLIGALAPEACRLRQVAPRHLHS